MNKPLSVAEAFARKVYTKDHRVQWELINWANSQGRAIFCNDLLIPCPSMPSAAVVVPSLHTA